MASKIAVLTVGAEILDGRVQDTNANFVTRWASEIGLEVAAILTCPDVESEIVEALSFLSLRAAAIVVSGGLGPTSDDLTREAISDFISKPLIRDEQVLQKLHALYERRGRKFDVSNEKQALFPQGASVVDNPGGTAAGFSVATDGGVQIFSLPGVPSELHAMFEASVVPRLRELCHVGGQGLSCRTLRIFGLAESAVGEKIESAGVPNGVKISYRASFPEIEVVIKATDAVTAGQFSTQAIGLIGPEFVYSVDPEGSMAKVVINLLKERNLTVSVAESCTGGLIGASLTGISGASGVFHGGGITYSNSLKSSLLKVDPRLIDRNGAVSREVALEMARGAQGNFGSDVGISVTGIAGPDGGSERTPVGTFFVGVATSAGTSALHYFFSSTRERNRIYSCWSALDALRRHLLGINFRSEHHVSR